MQTHGHTNDECCKEFCSQFEVLPSSDSKANGFIVKTNFFTDYFSRAGGSGREANNWIEGVVIEPEVIDLVKESSNSP